MLRERRSGRVYDAAKVLSDVDMNALFEAARWAPSAWNLQPWRFSIARRGDANWGKLLGLLIDANRMWAQNASALMLTAVHTMRRTQEGQSVPNGAAFHDAGLFNMSILTESVHRGLMSHIMVGFDKDAARTLIRGAEQEIEPVTMMAIGYAGSAENLPEDLRKRETAPRVRRAVEELLIQVP